MVGEISRKFFKVSPINAGTGLPSSMYMVPPWCKIKLKSWLPPKVWFHGVQSTKTNGSSAMAGMDWLICCTLAQIIFCVLITPFGNLVEPLVNKNLTTVSCPVAATACATCGEISADQEVTKFNVFFGCSRRIYCLSAILFVTTTTSGFATKAMALPYFSASLAYTKPGVMVSKICLSFSKSWLSKLYAVDTLQ